MIEHEYDLTATGKMRMCRCDKR